MWPLTQGARVLKRRYLVPERDVVWEIDEFLDRSGLWLAEVELEHVRITPRRSPIGSAPSSSAKSPTNATTATARSRNEYYFMSFLLVAIGGAIGSMARYWLGGSVNRMTHLFPAGTFAVNVVGSLLVEC